MPEEQSWTLKQLLMLAPVDRLEVTKLGAATRIPRPQLKHEISICCVPNSIDT